VPLGRPGDEGRVEESDGGQRERERPHGVQVGPRQRITLAHCVAIGNLPGPPLNG